MDFFWRSLISLSGFSLTPTRLGNVYWTICTTWLMGIEFHQHPLERSTTVGHFLPGPSILKDEIRRRVEGERFTALNRFVQCSNPLSCLIVI